MRREEFEKRIAIDEPVLSKAKVDLNACIQGLLKGMIEKEASAGSVTLKINFEINEQVTNKGIIRRLSFKHKVTNAITLKAQLEGETFNADDELENVDGEWILMPITGLPQRTLLDEEGDDD